MGCAFALHGLTIALFDRHDEWPRPVHRCLDPRRLRDGTEAAVPKYLYYGETYFRQTGMHAADQRQAGAATPPPTARTSSHVTEHRQ